MKEHFNKIWDSANIIVVALIIGICIVIGFKAIATNMRTMEINVSEKTMQKFIDGIKSLRGPGEWPGGEMRPVPGSKRVEGVVPGSNPVKGNAKAPVLMVQFSDFQCPFSKRFYKEVFPQIEKEYISTGKVKFAYRDFPLDFHPLAKGAAAASRCAGRQNKYWEMFDKLSQSEALDTESLKKYAQEIKLDMQVFNACLNEQKIKDGIEKDLKDGLGFGVSGTPSFFINGRFVVGAQPFDIFKKIIEEELKNPRNKNR